MKRLLAFFLCIVMLLSGCATKIPETAVPVTDPPTQPPASDAPAVGVLPEQKALSAAELMLACEQIDFALLAAAFLNDEKQDDDAFPQDDYAFPNENVAYIGDADNNGHMEMVYTNGILFFENQNDDKISTCIYNGAGAPKEIYIANDASIYVRYSKEDIFREHGDHEHRLGQTRYRRKNAEDSYTVVEAKDTMKNDCDEDLSYGWIGDREVSWEEVQSYKESLNFVEVNGSLSDYISCSYGAAYYDSIAAGLEDYFSEWYGCIPVETNLDDDEFTETVFVVDYFVSRWLENYSSIHPAITYDMVSPIDPVDNRNGYVVLDLEDGKMTVQTACINMPMPYNPEPKIERSGSKLLVEGFPIPVYGWGAKDTGELSPEYAYEILRAYDEYCSFGTCNGAKTELLDEWLKREVLLAGGLPEADMDMSMQLHMLYSVACCSTEAEARAHVEEYVDAAFLPHRTDNADQPIVYNGVLYKVVEAKGYNGYQILGVLSSDESRATYLLGDYIFDENFVAEFRVIDGKWKLVDIRQEHVVKDYSDVYVVIAPELESTGYQNIVIKPADLGDGSDDELLCLCQRDGVWYLIIYIIVDHSPVLNRIVTLDGQACYLTEYEGQVYLLTYKQNVSAEGSSIYNSYSFVLSRFDNSGNEIVVEEASTGYYNDASNAQDVADFFEKLNKYLIKIIVLFDPYKLTGKTFMEQSEASYGQVPPEPEQEQEEEKPEKVQMGFVQIQDPSSWLNLREGPGLDYECVRIDPNDPGSIVKQALGSPVTVLEEVEGADGAWLKIRITYQDRVIVGYSYKAYIRLVNE